VRTVFFCSFICYFLGAIAVFIGQAWAERKGKLATCRQDTSEPRSVHPVSVFTASVLISSASVSADVA
jgi:hypothetical protein